MKNLQRSTFALSILIALLVAGCASDYTEGLDGRECKDSAGIVWRMNHRLGDLYAPKKIDIEEAKRIADKYGN